MNAVRRLLLSLAFLAACPADAFQPSLEQRVAAELAEAPAGTRFGLLVTAEDGRELIAINPDGRFIPASNTKLLTTAAAFVFLPDLDRPDVVGGAEVRLEARGRGAPDVVLVGNGDARLSSAPDCVTNCLAALADAVAARTRRVHDVIGDARLFQDQRWSPGMSWNNIHTRSGTAISALSLDDNELPVRVVPGAAEARPTLELMPYVRVINSAWTRAGNGGLGFDRLPGSDVVHLSGTISPAAEPVTLRLGVDDPARYAAWRLRALLEARGVRVSGTVSTRQRGPGETATASSLPPLARALPLPLAQDLILINKVSQNMHAELLLRRLGVVAGTGGTIEDGVARIAEMMARAGAARTGWDLSDGSGMSTYNRLSPRAMVALLRWAARQPWGARWRETFPIAGVDGTLSARFRGTPLERRLFAKTGTLNASNALSGYLVAASGRTLIFSFFANDVPGGGGVTPKMDEVLNLIAAGN